MDPFGLSRTTQMTSRRKTRTSWTSPSSCSRRRKRVVNRGVRRGTRRGARREARREARRGARIQRKMFLLLSGRLRGSNKGQPS